MISARFHRIELDVRVKKGNCILPPSAHDAERYVAVGAAETDCLPGLTRKGDDAYWERDGVICRVRDGSPTERIRRGGYDVVSTLGGIAMPQLELALTIVDDGAVTEIELRVKPLRSGDFFVDTVSDREIVTNVDRRIRTQSDEGRLVRAKEPLTDHVQRRCLQPSNEAKLEHSITRNRR